MSHVCVLRGSAVCATIVVASVICFLQCLVGQHHSRGYVCPQNKCFSQWVRTTAGGPEELRVEYPIPSAGDPPRGLWV